MRATTHRLYHRLPPGRRLTVSTLAALAATTLATAAAQPAAAVADTPAAPTITSSFTPNVIGVGGTTATALAVTITNPNATGTLSNISFTDTLPSNLAVDNPNGENGTCGTSSTVTANPGSQTFSLSGGSLKGGTNCTVSISVIANQTGVVQNSTGPVSSSAGAGSGGDTETLTVLPAPTVTVSGLRNRAKLDYGQVSRVSYSCSQPDDPQALSDCSAADDAGNTIASGHSLKTKSPGDHTLTVSATSSDGTVTTDTIDYTVLPNNRFTITSLRSGPSGSLSFTLALPGAGKVKAVETSGARRIATSAGTVGRARKLKVTLRPSAGAPAGARATLEVTYTPTGGRRRTVTKRGIALA